MASGRFVNSCRRCGAGCCLQLQVLSSSISFSYADHEDGSISFFRNVSNFTNRHSVMFRKVRNFVNNAVGRRNLENLGWLYDRFSDETKVLFCRLWNISEMIKVILVVGGGSKLLRKVYAYVPIYTASYSRYTSLQLHWEWREASFLSIYLTVTQNFMYTSIQIQEPTRYALLYTCLCDIFTNITLVLIPKTLNFLWGFLIVCAEIYLIRNLFPNIIFNVIRFFNLH